MSFHRRASRHDEQGIPLVIDTFARYDFGCHILGIEIDSSETRQALMSQSDSTSIMLRYRPDRFFTQKGNRSVLCEVKTEWQGHKNFAIEFDSYVASKQWNLAGRHVMYALVDLGKESISCCWVDSVLTPNRVYVPKRYGFTDTWQRLNREHADINFVEGKYTNGSGTPYFLIPKTARYLCDIDDFVTRELMPICATEPELEQLSFA